MKCPHCNEELKLEPYVVGNVDVYDKVALGKAQCCGKGVTVHPVRSVRVEKYLGNMKIDDWGDKFE